jgi:hypothetical protein
MCPSALVAAQWWRDDPVVNDPPAGWYPDPTNPPSQRYWDGTAWRAPSPGAATTPWTAVSGATLPTFPPLAAAVPGRRSVGRLLALPAVLTGVVSAVTLGAALVSDTPGIDALLGPRVGLAVATVVLGLVSRVRWLAIAGAVAAVALTGLQGWAGAETVGAWLDDEASLGQALPAVFGQACLAFVAIRSALAVRH